MHLQLHPLAYAGWDAVRGYAEISAHFRSRNFSERKHLALNVQCCNKFSISCDKKEGSKLKGETNIWFYRVDRSSLLSLGRLLASTLFLALENP